SQGLPIRQRPMVAVPWSSPRSKRRLLQVLASLAMLLAGASAMADPEVIWPVKGKLRGQGANAAHDLSGIACDRPGFPRLCLVIDDESQEAQVVILRDGELMAGDSVPLLRGSMDGKPLELDGEGVAFADGAFYVIGSHGQPRHSRSKLDPARDAARIAARIRASSQ